jgi:tRNA-specific 2-thiouridylase
MNRLTRMVVGLSGGVDSAVSAYLLKQQGHEVIGVFMKNWEDDDSPHCASRQDFLDAAAVADVLGIDLEWVNFSQHYQEAVFAGFLREYQAGRTPNPDVLCNTHVKFDVFLTYAHQQLGADRIATGHYARLQAHPEQAVVTLLKGVDAQKDQSYFLHRLAQEPLSRACFPVGELTKPQVRQIAQDLRLPNAQKKDSTGICFIGERPFAEFLNQYIAHQPGPICGPDGQVIGQHQGLAFYTLGQRQGLGIGGVKAKVSTINPKNPKPDRGLHAPWFVARKDLKNNVLWVVQGHDHPWLLSTHVRVEQAHWISGAPPSSGTRLRAKTRYRQADAPCQFIAEQLNGTFALQFDEPQWAVTPGQFAVLYQGDMCLGGGVIEG